MAGLVALLREETDGNASGGWEEEGEQTNNQQNYPPKPNPRTNIALVTPLHGGDAAQGCEGGFSCSEMKSLSPSHPLDIPKAKEHVLKDGFSSAYDKYS